MEAVQKLPLILSFSWHRTIFDQFRTHKKYSGKITHIYCEFKNTYLYKSYFKMKLFAKCTNSENDKLILGISWKAKEKTEPTNI